MEAFLFGRIGGKKGDKMAAEKKSVYRFLVLMTLITCSLFMIAYMIVRSGRAIRKIVDDVRISDIEKNIAGDIRKLDGVGNALVDIDGERVSVTVLQNSSGDLFFCNGKDFVYGVKGLVSKRFPISSDENLSVFDGSPDHENAGIDLWRAIRNTAVHMASDDARDYTDREYVGITIKAEDPHEIYDSVIDAREVPVIRCKNYCLEENAASVPLISDKDDR